MDVTYGGNTKQLIKKNRKIKTLEKVIRIINFNAPAAVLKEMHKLKILKLKDFIKLKNILFINLNDCFDEERSNFKTYFL